MRAIIPVLSVYVNFIYLFFYIYIVVFLHQAVVLMHHFSKTFWNHRCGLFTINPRLDRILHEFRRVLPDYLIVSMAYKRKSGLLSNTLRYRCRLFLSWPRSFFFHSFFCHSFFFCSAGGDYFENRAFLVRLFTQFLLQFLCVARTQFTQHVGLS